MNMFDNFYAELESAFVEAEVAEETDISLDEFLRYELISSWDRRITEDQEFIAEWERKHSI